MGFSGLLSSHVRRPKGRAQPMQNPCTPHAQAGLVFRIGIFVGLGHVFAEDLKVLAVEFGIRVILAERFGDDLDGLSNEWLCPGEIALVVQEQR